VIKQHTSVFEGIEGISAACVIQPGQGEPRQYSSQPGPQDLADSAQAQRAKPHSAKPIRLQGAIQAERDHTVGAEGQQEGGRLVLQAAEAELHYPRGGSVQPLRVVHGDHEGSIARKDPQPI
jgi:hypothetical protein